MSYTPLNAVRTADAPTDAATMTCAGAVRVDLEVEAAPILYQLGEGIGGVQWRPPARMAPGFRSLDVRADAVRVYSANPGSPATVTVTAYARSELP